MDILPNIYSFYYETVSAAAAKSLQSCPTLCDPIDGSPPGSPIPGILQASTLEWVAISFSTAWKWKVKVKSLSCVQLLATPLTTAYQVVVGFSRREYWSGVPLPSLETASIPFLFFLSCIEPRLVICFLNDSIYVSMPFSQIIPPSPSPTESKSLFFTSVSLLLSHIQGYHYHLSEFHIYVF